MLPIKEGSPKIIALNKIIALTVEIHISTTRPIHVISQTLNTQLHHHSCTYPMLVHVPAPIVKSCVCVTNMSVFSFCLKGSAHGRYAEHCCTRVQLLHTDERYSVLRAGSAADGSHYTTAVGCQIEIPLEVSVRYAGFLTTFRKTTARS
jgi:hypothetical protein